MAHRVALTNGINAKETLSSTPTPTCDSDGHDKNKRVSVAPRCKVSRTAAVGEAVNNA